MPAYALGLDFGTESARALLVDVADGREVATAVAPYPHGVVDEALPDGTRLPHDWALQDADDYWSALDVIVPAVLREGDISAEQVIGLGVDFTASTVVPTTTEGIPLSRIPELRGQPHAWTKLWKHHGAERHAERLNAAAMEREERFLIRYGRKTSSEWLHAKAWQLLEEAPDLYDTAACLVEGGDWVVWQLTGQLSRSACQAGYKALWSRADGYPSPEFLGVLNPRLADLERDKLRGEVLPVGRKAGGLTQEAASRLGLQLGTAVAVSIIDAHAAVPAAGVSGPGKMLVILGTSGCHIVLGEEDVCFPGIQGVVQDGVLPGYFGYEAGQPATGDILAWYTRHGAPAATTGEAERRGLTTHELLTERAAALHPGEVGLLALDWWNGNRSVLMDADLTGVLVGLSLDTRPEHIYRALIEGTAFGTRIILENFEQHGVSIQELIAAGGLAERNELLMQIYSDVTGRPLSVTRSGQACALGAAIFGAVAAGSTVGGYDSLPEAVARMGGVKERTYTPDPVAHLRYTELYRLWQELHGFFGDRERRILQRLKSLRTNHANNPPQ